MAVAFVGPLGGNAPNAKALAKLKVDVESPYDGEGAARMGSGLTQARPPQRCAHTHRHEERSALVTHARTTACCIQLYGGGYAVCNLHGRLACPKRIVPLCPTLPRPP